jgi:hypothetical protein
MSAPLRKLQKRILSQLARRAFNLVSARARGRGEAPDTSAAAMDAWRHNEVAAACGKFGLRCCGQDDYRLVQAHFHHLLGEDGRALNDHVEHLSNGRRQAEAVLWREIQRAASLGITREYVASICSRQNRCSILDASEKQLWHLVFTVRTRAAARRRQIRQEPHCQETQETQEHAHVGDI